MLGCVFIYMGRSGTHEVLSCHLCTACVHTAEHAERLRGDKCRAWLGHHVNKHSNTWGTSAARMTNSLMCLLGPGVSEKPLVNVSIWDVLKARDEPQVPLSALPPPPRP